MHAQSNTSSGLVDFPADLANKVLAILGASVSIPTSKGKDTGRVMARHISLSEACELVVSSKSAARLRPTYIRSLRQYLAQFARGREHVNVRAITPEMIEEWFLVRGEAPSARASNLGRLSALFSWCYRRGFIDRNPCDRVERVRIERDAPHILTVDEAERLLRAAEACECCCRTYMVLSLFAGLRPGEARQIRPEDILVDSGVVIVRPETSKVRQRRVVDLQPNAVAWLRSCEDVQMPMSIRRWRNHNIWARAQLGWPSWSQDVYRHSAASYWLASVKDAGKVAYQLGNSPSILSRHYRELVSAEAASKYWSLSPRNGQQMELL